MAEGDSLNIDHESPLGGARAGSVFKGTWSPSGNVVAVKILASDASLEALQDRIEVWRSLQHPNVLEVYGISPHDVDPAFLIAACHPNGNVRQFLSRVPNADRPNMVFETALGMQYLHSRGLVHGSLKPSNILVKDDGQVCIGDCSMVEVQTSKSSDAHRYFSPEAWKGTLSRPSDVYAFAMSAYEILTSTLPWGVLSEKHIYQLVLYEDTRPDRPDTEGCTDEMWGIIEEAWHKESRLRPSFDIIVNLWQGGAAVTDPSESETGDSLSQLHIRSRSNTQDSAHSMASGPPAYDISNAQHNFVAPPVVDVKPLAFARRPTPGVGAGPSSHSSHSSHSSQQYPSQPYPSQPYPSQSYPTRPDPSSPSSSSTHLATERAPRASRLGTFNPNSFNRAHSASPPPSLRAGMAAGSRASAVPSLARSVSTVQSQPPLTPMSRPGSMLRPAASVRNPPQGGGQASLNPALDIPGSQNLAWDPANLYRNRMQTQNAKSNSNSFDRERQYTPNMANFPETDEGGPYANGGPYAHGDPSNPSISVAGPSGVGRHYSMMRPDAPGVMASPWEQNHLQYANPPPLVNPNIAGLQPGGQNWDGMSMGGGSSFTGTKNAVLLAGALAAEVKDGRKREIIDMHLASMQHMCTQSDKDAEKLVTAGAVHTLIHLLKIRAGTGDGLESVLITLGLLAHDSLSANTIYRTNTTTTLIEIANSSLSDDITTLAIWCLNRICRSSEIAQGLIKKGLPKLLVRQGLQNPNSLTSRSAAWCLGSLVHTDSIADNLADQNNIIIDSVDHLRKVSSTPTSLPEDVCAALYVVARMSRSIRLAKALNKAGCTALLAQHMNKSLDPEILNWSARAVGCLMRPNSGDMAKALLEAGTPVGLARIPRVLPSEEVEPLASFAFAIQRFCVAEWGGGTRKALVDAGVVDSLLAALRTAADEPFPQVHVELAQAVSFLGDVGGSAIRKEVISAGGIEILKRVGKIGSPEVSKACGMAVTSITGNIFTRNAANAKTAMSTNWSGGCPDYQPPCPFALMDVDAYEP